MVVHVNGQAHAIENTVGLEEFVVTLGLEPKMLLIEYNGLALLRQEWALQQLSEGDRIELFRVAAGG
jgi:sulfur carrier protein